MTTSQAMRRHRLYLSRNPVIARDGDSFRYRLRNSQVMELSMELATKLYSLRIRSFGQIEQRAKMLSDFKLDEDARRWLSRL